MPSLIGLVSTASCCDEPELSVGDIQARGDFAISVSVAVEFSVEHEIAFDGDLAAWAGLAAASSANFGYDVSGKRAYAQQLELDVDDDGVNETVEYLAFSNGLPTDIERGFASWHGDRYSFDAGLCHMLSWQGSTGRLLSGRCDDEGAALACPVGLERSDASDCRVCDATGACSDCSDRTLAECLDEHPASFSGDDVDGATASSTTGTTGVDVTIGTGGAAGAAAVSGEFDSCVEEVQTLADVASQCGLPAELDSSFLCSERLSDVNLCFVAVEGARIFGSVCSVATSTSCDGVFR